MRFFYAYSFIFFYILLLYTYNILLQISDKYIETNKRYILILYKQNIGT